MGREDDAKKAEQELNRIRKLPENKSCANCLAPGAPLHTAVVMPFRIFVCSTCKSAHQSFSHRCKSTQMSLWTMDEVRQLDDKKGGGNRIAQETWLALVRDKQRPREGDSLDIFKDFVKRVYEEQRFKGDGSAGRSDGRDRNRTEDSRPDSRRDDRGSDTGRRSSRDEKAQKKDFDFDPNGPSRPAASSKGRDDKASSCDLLFDDFDPSAPSTQTPQQHQAAAPLPVSNGGSGFDLFGDFVGGGQNSAPVGSQPQVPQAVGSNTRADDFFDPFALQSAAPQQQAYASSCGAASWSQQAAPTPAMGMSAMGMAGSMGGGGTAGACPNGGSSCGMGGSCMQGMGSGAMGCAFADGANAAMGAGAMSSGSMPNGMGSVGMGSGMGIGGMCNGFSQGSGAGRGSGPPGVGGIGNMGVGAMGAMGGGVGGMGSNRMMNGGMSSMHPSGGFGAMGCGNQGSMGLGPAGCGAVGFGAMGGCGGLGAMGAGAGGMCGYGNGAVGCGAGPQWGQQQQAFGGCANGYANGYANGNCGGSGAGNFGDASVTNCAPRPAMGVEDLKQNLGQLYAAQ